MERIKIIANGILDISEIDRFKFFDENEGVQREVGQSHVKDIKERMEYLCLDITVKINQDWKVLDGQHSLTAYKELIKNGKITEGSIAYIMYDTKSKDCDVCNVLNTKNKNWAVMKTIESKVKQGDKNYILLKELHDKYIVKEESKTVELFTWSALETAIYDSRRKEKFKLGMFAFKENEYEELKDLLEKVYKIHCILKEIGVEKGITILNNKECVLKYFSHALKDFGFSFERFNNNLKKKEAKKKIIENWSMAKKEREIFDELNKMYNLKVDRKNYHTVD